MGFVLLLIISPLSAQTGAEDSQAPGEDFLFEGELTRMDGELAPTLREGQVLSGFFTLNLAGAVKDEDPSAALARYADIPIDGEFLLDVNHVLAYAGHWRDGHSWLTLTRGDGSGKRPSELYCVTLPMDGEPFGEDGWTPRWLQIWLMGDPNELLTSLEIQPPPESVGSGWFRISFWDETGTREATAEGPIHFIGPEGEELSPTEQIAQLQRVVADLGTRLRAAESETARLEEELRVSENRVRGLNRTLDVLISERAALQDEVERLKATGGEADEELVKRVADLEAEKVLLGESKAALEVINRELARSLQERERELREAREAMQRLIAQREAAPGKGILDQPVPDSPHPFLSPGQLIPGQQNTSQTVVGPQPEAVSEEMIPAPPPPAGERLAPELEEKEESPENEDESFSFGRPRKFRRGGR